MLKKKLFGIMTFIVGSMLMFTLPSCGGDDEDSKGSNFTSIDAFNKWLSKQPKNTPDKPYKVKMKIKDTKGRFELRDSSNNEKYVYLDFSDSTINNIPDEYFLLCGTLVGITTGNSVTSIGKKAFSYSGLISATIESGSIGEEAFNQCGDLSSLTLGNGVTSIGNNAFFTQKLTELIIPNSVTRIGNSAFSNCNKITRLTLGNKVTTIEDGAFWGCTGLTSVTIPDSVTSLGGFEGCTGLTSLTIGNSVANISNDAFCGCASLTSVTIPSSVTRIGKEAFSDYRGVPYTRIGITSVTFNGTIPSSGFYLENAGFPPLTPFPGDLRNKFYETDPNNGTPGTYTRPDTSSDTWTKL